MGLVDGGKGIGHVFCHLPGVNLIVGTILYGAIAGVAQATAVEHFRIDLVKVGRRRVYELFVGIDKEHQHLGRHLVGAIFGVKQLRERNLSGIAWLMLDVASGAAYHHLLQHRMAQLLVDGIDTRGQCLGRNRATLRHQGIVFLNPRGKGVGDVAHTVESAARGVLKQQQLVLDVLRGIVERRGRKQQHFLSTRDVAFVGPRRLGDALQQVVVARGVVTEIVRLIDDDEIVIWRSVVVVTFDDLIQTAVAHKSGIDVFYLEVIEGLFPVATHGGREDDEDTGVVAIGGNEPLGNHGGNHGLAQAHYVGDETAAVTQHDFIALHHGVTLVGEVIVAGRQHRDEIVLHLGTEVVDEHPHVKLIGRGLLLLWREVGAAHHAFHIVYRDGDGHLP